MQRTSRCLVVGPQGVGKSLLLKKLKIFSNQSSKNLRGTDSQNQTIGSREILPTLPTVGSTVEELKVAQNATCLLKEYGGCMAPVWNTVYAECDLVLYVVDASNCTQVSAATVLLLELLGSQDLRDKPFLVFFNKLDCDCPMSLAEYQSVMRLSDIRSHAPQTVCVVAGSCATGQSLHSILQWVEQQTTARTSS